MNLGVEPQRMEISGFGEYRPRAENTTAAGRDQNRRVLIIILDPSLREPGTTQVTGAAGPAAPGLQAVAGASPPVAAVTESAPRQTAAGLPAAGDGQR